MKYEIGQKLKYIGHNQDGKWTTNKIYEIHSFSDDYRSFRGPEYHIIRDDRHTGLWWEVEVGYNFCTLKEERKQKIQKINKLW